VEGAGRERAGRGAKGVLRAGGEGEKKGAVHPAEVGAEEYQTTRIAGGQKITPAKEMLARKPEEIIFRARQSGDAARAPLGYAQLQA